VAFILNLIKYREKDNWKMIDVWLLFLKEGKFYGLWSVFETYKIFVFGIILIVLMNKFFS